MNLTKLFPQLPKELLAQIKAESDVQVLPKELEILKIGQYVKVIPVVIDGLIKVFTQQDDKELLLYYIKPNESCIMSFSSSISNEPSKVYAVTEEETKALLLPIDKVSMWTKEFPDFNHIFYQQYNQRYGELLNTIHHLLFDKLDKRICDYLVERSTITNENPVKVSHRQIAAELGTAREVVSRTLKKLEAEGKIKQANSRIHILACD